MVPRRKKPRPYLDTNVILDYIRKRNDDSEDLLREIKNRRLTCWTSYFTLLELLDKEQENKWIERRAKAGETFDDILRHRYPRELEPDELEGSARVLVESFIRPFVEKDIIITTLPDAQTWDNVARLMRRTNLSMVDAFHVDAATSNRCNIFITRDSGLVKIIEDNKLMPASRPAPNELDKRLATQGLWRIVKPVKSSDSS